MEALPFVTDDQGDKQAPGQHVEGQLKPAFVRPGLCMCERNSCVLNEYVPCIRRANAPKDFLAKSGPTADDPKLSLGKSGPRDKAHPR